MNATRMSIVSVVLVIVGFAGGYALADGRTGFVLYHIGGLGALGLLASAAGAIANKKGHGFRRAFLPALLSSALIGLIAAFAMPPTAEGLRPSACGGSVSLIVALIFIIFWAVRKPAASSADPLLQKM